MDRLKRCPQITENMEATRVSKVTSLVYSEHLCGINEIICDMCASGEPASKHCDDCLMNLCDSCVVETHRKLQAGRSHQVNNGVTFYDMEKELCQSHGQKMSFFCKICRLRVCPECEMEKKSHVLHPVISLSRYVGQEREELLDRLDYVTNKMETVSFLSDDFKSMALKIELKWLECKEFICQEFASLYETIAIRQQELIKKMEKAVEKSLEQLKCLQKKHESLQVDTCQLSDECIAAVQMLSVSDFLKDYPKFIKSCQQLEKKVESIQSTEDFMPTFLKVPFSLHKEKVHLDQSLRFQTFDCLKIKPKEYNIFIPYSNLQQKMTLNSLMEISSTNSKPPSSSLHYTVQIMQVDGKNELLQWSSRRPMKSTECLLNGDHNLVLKPGTLYVLKIMPILTCNTHSGQYKVEGSSTSIMIITEQNPWFLRKQRPASSELNQATRQGNALNSRLASSPCKASNINNNQRSLNSAYQLEENEAVPDFPFNHPHLVIAMENNQRECANEVDKPLSFEESRILEDTSLKFFTAIKIETQTLF